MTKNEELFHKHAGLSLCARSGAVNWGYAYPGCTWEGPRGYMEAVQRSRGWDASIFCRLRHYAPGAAGVFVFASKTKG